MIPITLQIPFLVANTEIFLREIQGLRDDPSRRWQEQWLPEDADGKVHFPLSAVVSYLPDQDHGHACLDLMMQAGLRRVELRSDHMYDHGVLCHVYHSSRLDRVRDFVDRSIGLTAAEGSLRALAPAMEHGHLDVAAKIVAHCNVEALAASFDSMIADHDLCTALMSAWSVGFVDGDVSQDSARRQLGWHIVRRLKKWKRPSDLKLPVSLCQTLLTRMEQTVPLSIDLILRLELVRDLVGMAIEEGVDPSEWLVLGAKELRSRGFGEALVALHQAMLLEKPLQSMAPAVHPSDFRRL